MFDFLQQFLAAIPPIVKALLLLVLAFIVAAIAKSLVTKLIQKTKLNDLLAKADGERPGSASGFIGKLVYLIVFLLFVPGIFGALGVESIANPISQMLNTIFAFLPNILGAAIILIVGVLVARLVRSLLIPLFAKIKIDKLQEKFGITVKADSEKLSYTLAYIVYVLILIPVIIMALQVLRISAISEPATAMLNKIFDFIPNILVACLIIFLGVIIGRFAGQIVTRLIVTTGVDSKISALGEGKMSNFIFSKVVGTIVNVLIIVFFTVEGFAILKLGILTTIGQAIIRYLPAILAAVIILICALLLSSIVEKALKKVGHNGYAAIAKVAIMVLAVFMILNQLGIAKEIVNYAFILTLGAIAVAFAIAFGVGGRAFAADVLKDAKEKIDENRAAAKAAKEAAAKAPAEEPEAEPVDPEEGTITDAIGDKAEDIADAVENKVKDIGGAIFNKFKKDKED